MMPVPRVMLRNSLRNPISAREAMINSMRTVPTALVCQVNPGEMFGISALIEPYTLTATARSAGQSEVLRLDLDQLHALFEKDPQLEILMMHKVAKAAIERLHHTRLLLVAAYA